MAVLVVRCLDQGFLQILIQVEVAVEIVEQHQVMVVRVVPPRPVWTPRICSVMVSSAVAEAMAVRLEMVVSAGLAVQRAAWVLPVWMVSVALAVSAVPAVRVV